MNNQRPVAHQQFRAKGQEYHGHDDQKRIIAAFDGPEALDFFLGQGIEFHM